MKSRQQTSPVRLPARPATWDGIRKPPRQKATIQRHLAEAGYEVLDARPEMWLRGPHGSVLLNATDYAAALKEAYSLVWGDGSLHKPPERLFEGDEDE